MRLCRRAAALFLASMFLAPSGSYAGSILSHEFPTFTIEISDGFERITANQLPDTLYSFGEAVPGPTGRLNFSLQDMGRTFRATRLKVEDYPELSSPSEMSFEDWDHSGVTLSTAVNKFTYGSFRLFSLTIQIPPEDRGLRINVTGGVDREQEVRQLLRDLLRSLKGKLIADPVHVPPSTLESCGPDDPLGHEPQPIDLREGNRCCIRISRSSRLHSWPGDGVAEARARLSLRGR